MRNFAASENPSLADLRAAFLATVAEDALDTLELQQLEENPFTFVKPLVTIAAPRAATFTGLTFSRTTASR